MHKSASNPTESERRQALSYLLDHQLILVRLMAMEPEPLPRKKSAQSEDAV